MSRRSLIPLFVTTFVATSANGLVFALLADLQDEIGLSTRSLGAITAVYFVATVAAQLLLARFADEGHERLMMLVALVVTVMALLGMAWAGSFWGLFAFRALSGAATGTLLPAVRRLVAVADPDRVGENLGLITAAELMGFTVSPVAAGWMADNVGLRAPFYALAAITALAAVIFAALIRRTPARNAPAGARLPVLPRDLLSLRGVQVALLFGVAVFIPVGFYDALWSRYLQDRGATSTFVGASLAMYGLPYALLASTGGKLADRHGPLRVLTLGLTVVIPMTVGYGLAPRPGIILAVALVEAAGGALVGPALGALMVRAVPETRVAQAMGLLGALPSIVAAITGAVAAPTYARFGAITTLASAGVLMTVFGVWGRTHARERAA